MIFDALYYIPEIEMLFSECRRVLRHEGASLIASANKDLFDFNASPHSSRYLGVMELGEELGRHGFCITFFCDAPVVEASARQQLLRPVKAVAARLGVIPIFMNGKKLLKRLLFGGLVKMPAEVVPGTAPIRVPQPLPADTLDREHEVSPGADAPSGGLRNSYV